MSQPDEIALSLERGDAAVARGQLQDARRHFSSAVSIADEQQDARIIRGLHGLGYVEERLGAYPEAEESFRRSVVIAQAALGENHPLTARGLNHLALMVRLAGRITEARPLAEASLRISQAVQSGTDAAAAENTLALIALDMGDGADALRRLKRVVSMTEGLHGERHPDVAAALGNLGDLYRQMEREADALPLLQRALSIIQETYGADSLALATPLNNLALCHDSMGDFVLAEPLYQRAIGIWRQSLDSANPLVLGGELNLANLYRKLGKYDIAEPMFLNIIALFEGEGAPNHPYVGLACRGLSDLMRWTDREEEADLLRERADRIRTEQST